MVLPDPAAALTTVSGPVTPWLSRANNRARGTTRFRAVGTDNFAASSDSDIATVPEPIRSSEVRPITLPVRLDDGRARQHAIPRSP